MVSTLKPVLPSPTIQVGSWWEVNGAKSREFQNEAKMASLTHFGEKTGDVASSTSTAVEFCVFGSSIVKRGLFGCFLASTRRTHDRAALSISFGIHHFRYVCNKHVGDKNKVFLQVMFRCVQEALQLRSCTLIRLQVTFTKKILRVRENDTPIFYKSA